MSLDRGCHGPAGPFPGRAALFLALLTLWSGAARAQRADENATTTAEDAFGTTVGRESIGLYDSGNVRGFSPTTAGNLRIEGLYFDGQGGLTARVNDGETIHVGPSAQGFAFPAPTGVVDLSLRGSGDRRVLSPLVSTSSFGGVGVETDLQLPLGPGVNSSMGGGFYRNRYANGGGSTRWNIGLVPRWQVNDRVSVKAFFSREQTYRDTSQGLYIPEGDFLPQRIVRGRYPGPGFLLNNYSAQSLGVLGKAGLGRWSVDAGLFRSVSIADISYANVISVAADGRSTTRYVDAFAPNGLLSWSGEMRVVRRLDEGPRQHRVTMSLRGRSLLSRYGESIETELGSADLDAVIAGPRPPYAFGAPTTDLTRQTVMGLAYSLSWQGRGEMTVGLQRMHYTKEVRAPGLAASRGGTVAWLPTASATVRLSSTIALYGSYVRGLEDSGIAPNFATNANAVMPANRTVQFDLGARINLPARSTLIVGYFDIRKPYLDLNAVGLFGQLGSQHNRGLELSVTSRPDAHLTIVAGGIFARPRVLSSALIAEPIGGRTIGQPDVRAQLNVNYQLPFASRLTVDAYVNHDSSSAGTVSNAVVIPGSTRVGGGLRYSFRIDRRPVTLRLSVFNIGNVYRLIPVGSGVYVYNNPVNVSAYIAADL